MFICMEMVALNIRTRVMLTKGFYLVSSLLLLLITNPKPIQTTMTRFAALLLVAFTFLAPTLAYPYGAGSCAAGSAAFGGPHSGTAVSLAGKYQVKIGGVVVAPGATRSLKKNTSYTITVTGLSGKTFKGILIRLGEVSTTAQSDNALTAVSPLKKNTYCTTVGGVTHSNSNSKSTASTLVKVTAAATKMPLDISLIAGSVTGKFYSRYFITFA